MLINRFHQFALANADEISVLSNVIKERALKSNCIDGAVDEDVRSTVYAISMLCETAFLRIIYTEHKSALQDAWL